MLWILWWKMILHTILCHALFEKYYSALFICLCHVEASLDKSISFNALHFPMMPTTSLSGASENVFTDLN